MYRHKRSPYELLFFKGVIVLSLALLGSSVWSSNPLQSAASHRGHDVPVIMLSSSGVVPEDSGPGVVNAIFASPSDDQTVYLVDSLTGDVKQYSEGQASLVNASGPVVTSSNGYSAYQDRDSKVVIVDAAGKQVGRFLTYPVISLAVLRNGNVVVASPVGKHFLHVYNPAGRLLDSYGKIKNYTMPHVDDVQNRFLRRGKLLIDGIDNLYYVFQYIPLVQKYSPAGELIFERQVRGEAIDIQQKLAERFLSTKAPGVAGGIDIINSAAVQRNTGHLWVCMNGSEVTGTVYEYSEQGEKIREYVLQNDSPLAPKQRITGVKDIALTRSNLYALTAQHQVLTFNISDESTWNPADGKGSVQAETPCGTTQPWNGCAFNCPGLTCSGGNPSAISSNGSSLDCKAALQATLQGGYIVKSAACTTFPAGTGGTPPHMRGACKDDVVVCYNSNGQNSSHSITIDCPEPSQGACSGGGFEACEPCGSNNDCVTCDPFGYCAETGYCYSYSPILVDINGDGYEMTDAAGGIAFDINGTGPKESLSWTAAGADDAWLALDRNGNGVIDNGAELFGNFTPQSPTAVPPNGFLALAEYDKPSKGGNGDGVIDRRDTVFPRLLLWQDTNHNGISEPGELHTLPALGLASIDLDYKESRRVDQYGNGFLYRSKVRDVHGAHLGRWAWDVFLVPLH